MADRLDQAQFMREKLFGGNKSNFQRYREMVVGADVPLRDFLYYEVVTTLFGRVSGALGIVLRKLFYPRLFRRVGKGVIFGRDIIVRHGRNVVLGEQTVLDDGCFVDGRGAGPTGVSIGDRTVVGRYSIIQAKIGPITIGPDTDVGSGAVIVAQGGVEIGRHVVIGGNAKVSGGIFKIEGHPVSSTDAVTRERGQSRWTQGPIRIADRCMLGMNAIILDGVQLGEAAVVGAGTVVTRDLASHAVAAGVPAKVLHIHEPFSEGQHAGLDSLLTFREGAI